jgi:hypothetical protein
MGLIDDVEVADLRFEKAVLDATGATNGLGLVPISLTVRSVRGEQ